MPSTITTSRADPAALLAWYDAYHRELPWRVSPTDRQDGISPDPYRIWLSEIMLQQTTVAAVMGYFQRFTESWPDVHSLAAAPSDDVLAAWAGLGYYARARNLIKCAAAVSHDHGGIFPDTEEGLRELPGIGAYTAAAIAAIAFDRSSVVVDGNVERVMARLFAVEAPLPDAKSVLKNHAADLTPLKRPGDYAQAVMDLGATICTPRRPACALCPWQQHCQAHAKGIAETLPRKKPKKAKPIRHGLAWARFDRHGRVAAERRPAKGLLGGMLALPSTDWTEDLGALASPGQGWHDAGEIHHTFTHFHLRLQVFVTSAAKAGAEFLDANEAEKQMPTVFAKALRQARAAAASGLGEPD